MTTFQDPPLQSRRTVRQNERDQSPAAVVPTTGPAPTPVAAPGTAEPLTYTTQGRAPVADYDGPSFRARRTPDPVDAGSASPAWAPQYGGAGVPVAPAADPNSTFAPHPPAAPVMLPSSLDAEEGIEHTLTRRELRALRDAHGITAATSTDETAYPTPAPAAPVAAAPVAPAAPVASAAPIAPVPPVASVPPVIPDVAPTALGTPLAAPSSRLDSALAEFDQLAGGRRPVVATDPPAARGRRAAPGKVADPAAPPLSQSLGAPPVTPTPPPVAQAPAPAAAPVAQAPASPAPARAASPAPAPASAGPAQIAPDLLNPAPAPTAPPVPLVQPAPPAPASDGVEIATDGVAVFDALFTSAPAADPELVAQPVAPTAQAPTEQVIEATIVEPEMFATATPLAPAIAEPPTSTPPTGHWSTQAQLDDETQFGDVQLARNIGSTSGAVTTSALVLPSIPNHDFGPIGTGDIMVTGSISLPQSLSATGALPAQLDESDLDHLLDPGDHQVTSTDSQPVRAVTAVSTHTSSRGVMSNVKPKGTRGLTALIIAATSMAVIVGALFIVLVVTGQLG